MLRKLFTIWMAFARVIGTFNTYLLLSLLFICVLTPIGLLMRLFGRNLFSHRFGDSTWTARSGDEDLERQY